MHTFNVLVDGECGEVGSGEICGGNLCQSDKKNWYKTSIKFSPWPRKLYRDRSSRVQPTK